MNIFVLDRNPDRAARYHCNKHVVKMILETAQLLSTTHVILDGMCYLEPVPEKLTPSSLSKKPSFKTKTIWKHHNSNLYKATHINHPCAVWVRKCSANYAWTFSLFKALLAEYTRRYNKEHACRRLVPDLARLPKAICISNTLSEFALAMPDEFKIPGNAVKSYRNYYLGAKARMLQWDTKHSIDNTPDWAIPE